MEFLKFAIPLIGAVIAWFVNERRKRSWEEYQRKEDRYQELIKSLKGFHVATWSAEESKQHKNNFIDQLNLCWLYCPDDVIQKAYAFLDTVQTGQSATDEQKEKALGELVLAIRKDLIGRKFVKGTSLNPTDFRILTST